MKYEPQEYAFGVVESFTSKYHPNYTSMNWKRLIASFQHDADAFEFRRAMKKAVPGKEHSFTVVRLSDGSKVKEKECGW